MARASRQRLERALEGAIGRLLDSPATAAPLEQAAETLGWRRRRQMARKVKRVKLEAKVPKRRGRTPKKLPVGSYLTVREQPPGLATTTMTVRDLAGRLQRAEGHYGAGHFKAAQEQVKLVQRGLAELLNTCPNGGAPLPKDILGDDS